MLKTLSERLIDAMDNRAQKITGTALAKKCGVAQPSVSDWRSGKSKSMNGENLIDAADLLGVNPKWLMKGVGPKWINPAGAPDGHAAADSRPDYARPLVAKLTLEDALRLLGDCLTNASEEARKKALPLLHALLLNPDQAPELASIIAKSLGRAEAPTQERAAASR